MQNDFVIIDFEGEPARTLAERREKQSPLRTSPACCAHSTMRCIRRCDRASRNRPDVHDDLLQLGREWRDEARRTFLDGYEEVARAAGLPLPRAEGNGLLALFLLEKVCYELAYEVDNRPAWVGMPLRGLADLVATMR